MVAILEINKMQYVAKTGETIEARVSPEADTSTHEVKLLGLIQNDDFEYGTPYLDKKLDFSFGDTIKDQKVVASKFKAKARYRRKVGHRENYVQFTLNSVK